MVSDAVHRSPYTVEPHYNGQLKNCNNLIIIVIGK
jgi:hypothetical protein